jgi:hypothetical protein
MDEIDFLVVVAFLPVLMLLALIQLDCIQRRSSKAVQRQHQH